MKKAISAKQQGGKGCTRVFLGVWGLGFFAAGLFFFVMMFLIPFLNARAATTWAQTPCTILSSKVETHVDSEGDRSYSAEIRYEYEVDGQRYEGDRYSFSDISGTSASASKIVKAHPKGLETNCFFDPAAPQKSVISRELSQSFFWMALFPFVFIAIGGVAIGFSVFGFSKKSKELANEPMNTASELKGHPQDAPAGSAATDRDSEDLEDEAWSQPKKLKTETSRLTMLLVTLGIAIFWNGLVSVFIVGIFSGTNGIWGRVGMSLFMIPFVLVGLVLIFAVLYMFMTLFNPKIEVAMSTGAVPLGGEVDIAWELIGSARRIRNLKIEIQGEQSATYRRGTDTHTDTEIFELIPVCDVTNQSEIEFGSTTIAIPPDTMHTFSGGHNKISWTINVQGEIPWWPDLTERFPFRVKPTG